jgi:hypothetical protein
MRRPPVDVWDVSMFDGELLAFLGANAILIRFYWTERRKLFLQREAQIVRGLPEPTARGTIDCAPATVVLCRSLPLFPRDANHRRHG